jgi:pyrroline-5-carboxylate reductase
VGEMSLVEKERKKEDIIYILSEKTLRGFRNRVCSPGGYTHQVLFFFYFSSISFMDVRARAKKELRCRQWAIR